MNYCQQGHFVPETFLTCPQCAADRSNAAFHDLQLEFLRKVVSGEAGYALRVTRTPQKHVLMYTSYFKTFCGQELATEHQIAYKPYSTDMLFSVCAGCRAAIESAIQEVQAQ